MTPADLYRDCCLSAWRIEALQYYAGTGDEERQRAFREGRPLPAPGPGKLEDLKLIARLSREGRTVGRVHVVDRPLSDYVRYELAVYAENAAAGEEIRIADRSAHPELAEITGDFAIFDAEADSESAVILFKYDSEGVVHGYEISYDQEVVEQCRDLLDLAYAFSVPLSEFTAAAAA